jgi:hypothetical protein
MSFTSAAPPLDVDLHPDRPPLLRVEAAGQAVSWTSEHRQALRAAVAEHGSVLVRGLGLRDPMEMEAVVQRLTTGLMPDMEAFAPRERYAEGLYSSS